MNANDKPDRNVPKWKVWRPILHQISLWWFEFKGGTKKQCESR